VAVAATYPGTPSSEIGTVLERLSEKSGMYFEYSTNEKVALEVGAAAAASGLRSFVFMKHVGLNVASDPFVSLGYVGVRGGMVVLSADDPSMHSSQNEQDSRYYARLANIPMLEPSTPQECKEMLMAGYDLSERLGCPVLLRTSTRVNHARGIVDIGDFERIDREGKFEKDPMRFVPVPSVARAARSRQLERMKKAKELSEVSPFNREEGDGSVGVIASGVAYTYAKEFLEDVRILKLGFTFPLPDERMKRFIASFDRVVVLEELTPLLEERALQLSKGTQCEAQIIGKISGNLPEAYEYSPDTLNALKGLVKVRKGHIPVKCEPIPLPNRPPVLCAGCPHRATFYAVNKALAGQEAIFSSDIGCYTLGINPPLSTADFLLCMGSSVGAAGGFTEATKQKVIAFIGDSTLFHAGIPGIINAVFNDHRYVLVVLDNRTTAMTGHQPHPGTGRSSGRTTEPLDIVSLIKGCGVKHVEKVDPYDLKATIDVMKKALEMDAFSVVVSSRVCPLAVARKGRVVSESKAFAIDQRKCVKCKTCLTKFTCPALAFDGKNVEIVPEICIGCGCCAQVCPKKAIEVPQ